MRPIAGLLAIVVATALLVAACGGDDDFAGGVTLKQSDNGSTVTLSEGETLRVELEANPTTGFEWSIISAPNPSVLSEGGSNYVAGEGDQVGGGGIETWTFTAVGSGSTTVVMEYAQPFEPDDVASMFTFQADVR